MAQEADSRYYCMHEWNNARTEQTLSINTYIQQKPSIEAANRSGSKEIPQR
jgi:hypothetical protein